ARLKVRRSEMDQAHADQQRDLVMQAQQMVFDGHPLPASLLAQLDPAYRTAMERASANGPVQFMDRDAEYQWLRFTDKAPSELAGMDAAEFYKTYINIFDRAHLERGMQLIQQARGAVAAAKGSNTKGFEGAQLF